MNNEVVGLFEKDSVLVPLGENIQISSFNIEPSYYLVFQNMEGEVGRLEFDSGELVFKGKVHESAQYFIEYICESFKQKFDTEVEKKVNERFKNGCG